MALGEVGVAFGDVVGGEEEGFGFGGGGVSLEGSDAGEDVVPLLGGVVVGVEGGAVLFDWVIFSKVLIK